MFTSIYAFGKVTDAEVWVSSYWCCLIVFVILSFIIKSNRTRRGRIIVVIELLIAEIVCDFIWYQIYFPKGEYYNYGLGAIVGMLIWPACLMVCGIVDTIINKRYYKKRI